MSDGDNVPTVAGLTTEIGDALEQWARHISKLVNAGEVSAFPGRDS